MICDLVITQNFSLRNDSPPIIIIFNILSKSTYILNIQYFLSVSMSLPDNLFEKRGQIFKYSVLTKGSWLILVNATTLNKPKQQQCCL